MDPKPFGFRNYGTTCFMNVALHMLSNTEILYPILNKPNNLLTSKQFSNMEILLSYKNLHKCIIDKKNINSALNAFIQSLLQTNQKKKRSGEMYMDIRTQHDCSEFLTYMLECFHGALKRKVTVSVSGKASNITDKYALEVYNKKKEMYEKEYSEIMDNFYGAHIVEFVNIKTNKQVSLLTDFFCVLNVSFPEEVEDDTEGADNEGADNEGTEDTDDVSNFYECFVNEYKDEKLDVFKDDDGNHIDVVKKTYFWSFPNILIVTIKRYDNMGKKIINSFKISKTLDLNKYCIGYEKNNNYELYGVCYHQGILNFGHYFCAVKSQGKWYACNDEIVVDLEEDDVVSESGKVYCLFYKRIKPNS